MDADNNNPPTSRPKRRFVPRAPPSSRRRQPPPPISEHNDGDREAPRAQTLLKRFTANVARRGPIAEKNVVAPIQVAFQANTSTNTVRSYGATRQDGNDRNENLESKNATSDNETPPLPIVGEEKGLHVSDSNMSESETESDYVEPWDYKSSYYPTVLPWRKPYSGDPEQLDEEEFGKAAANHVYEENTMNDAVKLGFMEKCSTERMFLVKLPFDIPVSKNTVASRKGKEKVGSSEKANENVNLEGFAEGRIGKMLIYKSGAVKFKLGDTLFNVMPGGESPIPQDVAVINTKEQHCCMVGAVEKMRIAVSADVDFLLNSEANGGREK